ncbi:hypothetical protein GRF59_15240 [Paenibacillus sp. HJL G12]|uniref:Lipoprotein n=1 Tax=Paenibacillus dendrobii TaxID=2691084 RepID=A0A7X3LGP2_9BACL|nr:hypothetical protein [Paenibacillus dendrobii]MWV44976.1 hypothetical protein [Paenibacillus dendrobii]
MKSNNLSIVLYLTLIVVILSGCNNVTPAKSKENALEYLKKQKYTDVMKVLDKEVEKYIEMSKDPTVYNYKLDLPEDLKQKIDLYNYASSLNSKENEDYTSALDSLEYLDPIPGIITKEELAKYEQELHKLNPKYLSFKQRANGEVYEDPIEKQKKIDELKLKEEKEREERVKASNEADKNPYSPQIGMTKDQVLASTWGKPKNINRTKTATLTHEQWVYGSNRYLYFDNGILTTIQD